MKKNNGQQSIFITGGAGFIGSHLAEKLATTYRVTVYDTLVSNTTTFADNPNITLIEGDICDTEKLHHAMRGHTVVIAMAAAHLRLSMSDPLYVHNTNGTGALSTLIATKKAGIKRCMYISSSEVYGTAIDDNHRMTEDHPTVPTTVYGVSKYIGELYTKQFQTHEGLETTIIRPFNTYGPRSHFDGPYGEVIPRMVIRVMNGLPPIIFGDGSQSRDFTYVVDTVAGITLALEAKNTIGETINIAHGKEESIQTIATTICNLINPSISPIYKQDRPNDVHRHAADITKAKKLLSFSPSFSLEDGIKNYIDWVKLTYKNPKELLALIPDTNW